MLLVSALALGLGAFQLARALASNARQADTVAALDARQGVVTAATRTLPPGPGELARTRAVRRVTQNLATPWADLLESLESAPAQSVAILSIEPSVSKRSVRLTAEARNPQEMLNYLGALQRDARLSSVVLVSHAVQAQAPGTPVRFQVAANWGSPL